MGRPIKLSDRLAEAADKSSKIADRSVPAQIEHWANLGRAVERSLTGHAIELIKAAEGDPATLVSEAGRKAKLLEGLQYALTPEGQQSALLKVAERGPRYGVDPDDPSMLLRISPDGRRVRGRMIDGDFIPERFLPANVGPENTAPFPGPSAAGARTPRGTKPSRAPRAGTSSQRTRG